MMMINHSSGMHNNNGLLHITLTPSRVLLGTLHPAVAIWTETPDVGALCDGNRSLSSV